MAFLAPIAHRADDEFPARARCAREQLPVDNQPISVLGGSLGGTVALEVMTREEVAIKTVALVNPAVRIRSVADLVGPQMTGSAAPYPWTAESHRPPMSWTSSPPARSHPNRRCCSSAASWTTRRSRVDVAYFTPGRFAVSGGTRASAAGVILDPGFVWRGGQVVAERQVARVRGFRVRDSEKLAVSISGSEHLTLPRLHPGLRDVGVYLGTFGAARPMQILSAVSSAVMDVPGGRSAIRASITRFVKGSTGGPDADTRTRSGSYIVAAAYDHTGTLLAEARLSGTNVYDFTAGMLSWGAERAAAGGLQGTGALGPVDGFGLDYLQTGAADAGLARE